MERKTIVARIAGVPLALLTRVRAGALIAVTSAAVIAQTVLVSNSYRGPHPVKNTQIAVDLWAC